MSNKLNKPKNHSVKELTKINADLNYSLLEKEEIIRKDCSVIIDLKSKLKKSRQTVSSLKRDVADLQTENKSLDAILASTKQSLKVCNNKATKERVYTNKLELESDELVDRLDKITKENAIIKQALDEIKSRTFSQKLSNLFKK